MLFWNKKRRKKRKNRKQTLGEKQGEKQEESREEKSDYWYIYPKESFRVKKKGGASG